ncbi:MAG: hybrid sensor histidine kinase/response regulator [Alphaproteobacteria bacterium]|uniref:histidine kinase n=1 Tax=Candidatus Nitrobium versatile TaxID=2884831 RepID=A0A953M0V8_9BACT|nr:hybrid sensor histidine kinase/response regulator [Candidatus Nitrobium versatile]
MVSSEVKVLVVDDDSFVRDMLAMILGTGGYDVTTAGNGADALSRYSREPGIGLVISDMNMPEMNGLELIRNLRGAEDDVPIVILTGNNEISVAVEALNSGASDYLLKDENIQDTLLLSAAKVLEKHHLKRQNLQLMRDLALKNSELEKSNGELLALNALKNKFLGIAAHDLRNPLTSIRGLSEILIGETFGPLTEEQKEYLTIINTTSDEMLSLVNDLLDVSVIESGKLELLIAPRSLKEVIEERIRMNTVVAERKGISLQSGLAGPDEVPDILFDAHRIAQVIDNLVGNAIKFSPPGSSLLISLAREGNAAKVSVCDEGPGIPPEERSKLFGEFQKLSVQPTGGERSTGLGLAIVKKIVDAHRGSLSVESQVGSGSTFSFFLPLDSGVEECGREQFGTHQEGK